MPKSNDPSLEKARDYAQQSVNLEEYPKRAVVSRRKKKKGVNRVYRRKVKQLLLEETPLRDNQEHRVPESIKRQRVQKSGNVSLGKALEFKLHRRGWTMAANYFKRSYSSASHREGFAAFLTALTTGESDKTVLRETALYFAVCLDLNTDPLRRRWMMPKNKWLTAFFEDEPLWKPRLSAWVEQHR